MGVILELDLDFTDANKDLIQNGFEPYPIPVVTVKGKDKADLEKEISKALQKWNGWALAQVLKK